MDKKWYILYIQPQRYKSVKKLIEKLAKDDQEVGRCIGKIETLETKRTKKIGDKTIEEHKPLYPGYMLIELDLSGEDVEWQKVVKEIIRIPGVKGFAGTMPGQKPQAIPQDQAETMIHKAATSTVSAAMGYLVGDIVRIKTSPFEGFKGEIETIDYDKEKIKVKVTILGKATSIEVNFDEVEKI